jgi:PadR family transcriptional regulator PadR
MLPSGGYREMETELTKATICVLLLSLLSRKPMYGYEIATTIRRRTNGVLEWKEGALYPNLHKLEKDGLLVGEWQGAAGTRRRKYYRITEAGLAELRDRTNRWANFTRVMTSVLEGPDEGN